MEQMWSELLSNQYLNPEGADIEISVPYDGNKVARFPAHSFVLRLQSSVFSIMLDTAKFVEGKTGRVTIQGYHPQTVQHFIRILYTGKLPKWLSFFQLLELMKIAHHYDVYSILTECSRRINSETLPLAEACTLHDFAKLRNLEALEFICRDKIQNNFATVLKNDLHFLLDEDSFGYFLEMFDNRAIPSAEPNQSIPSSNFYRGGRVKNKSRLVDTLSQAKPDISQNIILNDDELMKAVSRWSTWRCCLNGEITSEDNILLAVPPAGERLKPILKTDGSQFISELVLEWMGKLYLNQQSSDLKICIEGEELVQFPGHRFVLGNQSSVFLSMCSNARKSEASKVPQIYLNKGTPRVVEIILRYIYTRFFPEEMSDADLIGSFKAALQYEIQDLQKICLSLIIPRVSISNSCELWVLASQFRNIDLLRTCTYNILENVNEVLLSCMHFHLDQTLIMLEVASISSMGGLRQVQKDQLLKWWGAWRCCLDGQEPTKENLSKRVDPILATIISTHQKPEKFACTFSFYSGVTDIATENLQKYQVGLYANNFAYKLISFNSESSGVLLGFKMYVQLPNGPATEQSAAISAFGSGTPNNLGLCGTTGIGIPHFLERYMFVLREGNQGKPEIVDAEMILKRKTKLASVNGLYSVIVKPRSQFVLRPNVIETISIAAKEPHQLFLPEFRSNVFNLLSNSRPSHGSVAIKILHKKSCIRQIFLQAD